MRQGVYRLAKLFLPMADHFMRTFYFQPHEKDNALLR